MFTFINVDVNIIISVDMIKMVWVFIVCKKFGQQVWKQEGY